MLFAMCADTGMLVSAFVFLLIAGVVACGLVVLAALGVAKLIEAWWGRADAIPLSPDAIPFWPENVP